MPRSLTIKRHGLVALLASVSLVVFALPVSAEFEIQESTIDPGEIQLQYRGAWHSGLPKGDVPLGPVLPDDEIAPLRQSHEVELQMSITSHWLLAFTHAFDEPIDDKFDLTAVEFESQIELITLVGNGLGLAIQGGVEQPVGRVSDEDPFSYHFGPIVELAQNKFLLTLNPLFFRERGDLSEQDGFGFEYGWQAKYDVSDRLALALEMFGEIEELAHAGPFNLQEHSIGPAFYLKFEREWEEGGREKSRELVLSLGAQFGLTDVTSDVALKVFIGYEYY
ncbi:MAG: hypothetical protein FJX44_02065 [Alphaproteobacteria bacterium]|nr:hypothetical protein [Alphaproteobacteria bacterium]